MTHRSFALAPLMLLLGCAHATPVTAAPIGADEAPKLKAAIVGTCAVTSTQKEGGEKKDASDLSYTFNADGTASYKAFSIVSAYKYTLDGRNIMMDGPYKAFRVDDYSGPVLKFFVYDLSEYYYCTKK